MSLVGKTFASYFKDLFHINNSNSGVDATTRNVKDGLGNSTSLSISDDVLSVQPVNDNTTGSMLVKNQGGSNILAVDTTNSLVKVGSGQVNATTQYAYFGIDNTESTSFVANTHYAIPFSKNSITTPLSIGTGTNPDTTYTISSTAHDFVNVFWYVPDAITIDGVYWWHGADAATGDTTRGHLMSYAIVSDNSSTSGDLSDGTVLADGADITNAGYEQSYYQSLTIQSANVSAGRVIIFAFRSDSVNSDFSHSVTVKYHIQ
tara:strand:+ start:599 stop:1381 length:783 start_codon:yes stop_codon:yes gene_type:complete